MKATIIAGLVFSCAGGVLAQEPGLVAHYSFDAEDLGWDSSTNAFHGKNIGGQAILGVKGQALGLDGASAVIVDGLSGFTWGDKFTVSAWFRRDGGFQHYSTLVNVGVPRNSSWEVNLGSEMGGRSIPSGVLTAEHPHPNDLGREVVAELGQWHHVAMTYDGAVVELFLDGVRVADSNESDRGPILPSPQPLRIGQAVLLRENKPAKMAFLTGAVDEVRIYRRVLSVNEIKGQFAELEEANQVPEEERPTPPKGLAQLRVEAQARASAPQPLPGNAIPTLPPPAEAEPPGPPPWSEPSPLKTPVVPIDEEDCCARLERWLASWKEGNKQAVVDELNRLVAP